MKKIKNKIIQLLSLSIFLITVFVNSVEAKFKNQTIDQAIDQHEYAQTIEQLADGFIGYYNAKEVEAPTLATVRLIVPLRPWVEDLYFTWMNNYEFEVVRNADHHQILNNYLDTCHEKIVNFNEGQAQIAFFTKEKLDLLVKKIEQDYKVINLNYLVNNFSDFYKSEAVNAPNLVEISNQTEISFWAKRFYDSYIDKNGVAAASQLDYLDILENFLIALMKDIEEDEYYILEKQLSLKGKRADLLALAEEAHFNLTLDRLTNQFFNFYTAQETHFVVLTELKQRINLIPFVKGIYCNSLQLNINNNNTLPHPYFILSEVIKVATQKIVNSDSYRDEKHYNEGSLYQLVEKFNPVYHHIKSLSSSLL